ncbi:hypothetical protein [Snuella sedimenti]|uniref:Uncharacterized protein n=1 Tax=Snuella sedimenti TaxID=2798802 RepID=A0A8J7J000_9FLAO|nr:hypothetical protein [Snuella sedimenti]MBJ6369800.1 hypothetical protein [Snuella sedimenti]
MKTRITIIFLVGFISIGFGQNRKERDYGHYKSLNLNLGYNYSFGDPYDKNFHLIDIGINKAMYGGVHGGGLQYGLGTEIGLNTEKFTIGPKISGAINLMGIVIGTELVTYTDFDNWTLRFIPFFGIGGEKGRLTINPHVILTNKNFQPIDKGLLSLTINLSLNRKKME